MNLEVERDPWTKEDEIADEISTCLDGLFDEITSLIEEHKYRLIETLDNLFNKLKEEFKEANKEELELIIRNAKDKALSNAFYSTREGVWDQTLKYDVDYWRVGS